MTDEGELVVVLNGGTVEADLVKGLLEQAGIEAFLYNELAPSLTGLVSGPIQVAVAQRDLAEAQALLQARSENPGEAQP
ncbi:MAG: DUF2007 domain-containing protein [Candidatus Latescibacteria bacterium]|nr:DUF2007 domain-containing protein [Candidatus Latescibacterota bacterium]